MRRELIDLEEGKIEMSQFDKGSKTKRINKLAGITEMVFHFEGT